MADGHQDDDEDDGPDDNRSLDVARRCDAVLPLLTFLVDRQDNASLVTMLALVLVLRALAR